jgi:hypothetical protein
VAQYNIRGKVKSTVKSCFAQNKKWQRTFPRFFCGLNKNNIPKVLLPAIFPEQSVHFTFRNIVPSQGSFLDRLTSSGPWTRLGGMKLASSKADLTDGFLLTNIIVDEFGAYSANTAWTGTGQDGIGTGSDCGRWDNDTAGFSGTIGYVNIYELWSGWTIQTCDTSGNSHLYCFED